MSAINLNELYGRVQNADPSIANELLLNARRALPEQKQQEIQEQANRIRSIAYGCREDNISWRLWLNTIWGFKSIFEPTQTVVDWLQSESQLVALQASAQIKDLRAQSETHRQSVEEGKRRLDEMKKELDQERDSRQDACESYQAEKRRTFEYQNQINALRQEIDSCLQYKKKFQDLSGKHKDLKRQFEEEKETNTRLSTLTEKLDQDNTELKELATHKNKETIHELSKENYMLNLKVDESEREKMQKDKSIKTLNKVMMLMFTTGIFLALSYTYFNKLSMAN